MAKKATPAPAPSSPAVGGIAVAGFTVKRTLTLPAFKLELDRAYVFKIEDAMRISDAKAAKGSSAVAKDGKTMEPATVVTAVNCETGERGILILGAVVKSVLEQEYPAGDYVGKLFQITKGGKQEGRRYHSFKVMEVEQSA